MVVLVGPDLQLLLTPTLGLIPNCMAAVKIDCGDSNFGKRELVRAIVKPLARFKITHDDSTLFGSCTLDQIV